MSLLNRIAISNGDKQRKEEATRHIAWRDQAVIVAWHQQLEMEIASKCVHPPDTKPQSKTT